MLFFSTVSYNSPVPTPLRLPHLCVLLTVRLHWESGNVWPSSALQNLATSQPREADHPHCLNNLRILRTRWSKLCKCLCCNLRHPLKLPKKQFGGRKLRISQEAYKPKEYSPIGNALLSILFSSLASTTASLPANLLNNLSNFLCRLVPPACSLKKRDVSVGRFRQLFRCYGQIVLLVFPSHP